MAGELVPRGRYAPMNVDDIDLAYTRLPKGVVAAIDSEAVRGLARAARVKAAGLVAETALAEYDLLARMEQTVTKNDPIAADLAAGIVRDYLAVARSEIRKMGRRS